MATLTINAGSSSLKFGIFDGIEARLRGQVSGFGATPTLRWRGPDGRTQSRTVDAHDIRAALALVLELAESHAAPIGAVGHRIVHGGPDYDRPVILTDEVMRALEGLAPLAPLHQPFNLACVRAAREAFPQARQVACFDTAFHRGHPFVSDVFALPYALYGEGVRRYGFHGISYEYIVHHLRSHHLEHASGRVVVAHLGSGASMCAIRQGRSIDSTMGFSALDGLPMGTRCGQLDPGVMLWLMQERGMDAGAISDLLYTGSGLKGLSGISGDMRELEASEDGGAARAIDYFVYRIQRELGSLAAALGGLDTLVFCGGIGENATSLRRRVCAGLGWLGIAFDDAANEAGAETISAPGSAAAVMRIATDEEQMIARHVADLAER